MIKLVGITCLVMELFLITSAKAAPEKPLFDRLGGEIGIRSLAGAFVNELAADSRLTQNPEVQLMRKKISEKEAKERLTRELCTATGGICKSIKKSGTTQGLGASLDLGPREWFYLVQDANTAMSKQKIGAKERTDLMGILLRAKDHE